MSAACRYNLQQRCFAVCFLCPTTRMRHPGSCYPFDEDMYTIWSPGGGKSKCQWGGESQTGRPSGGQQQRFRTGLCHFDREQRGPCWCQQDTRHPDEPSCTPSTPPNPWTPRNNSVSFKGLYRQYFSFTTLPCASDSLMPWADVIYLIMSCIDEALLCL